MDDLQPPWTSPYAKNVLNIYIYIDLESTIFATQTYFHSIAQVPFFPLSRTSIALWISGSLRYSVRNPPNCSCGWTERKVMRLQRVSVDFGISPSHSETNDTSFNHAVRCWMRVIHHMFSFISGWNIFQGWPENTNIDQSDRLISWLSRAMQFRSAWWPKHTVLVLCNMQKCSPEPGLQQYLAKILGQLMVNINDCLKFGFLGPKRITGFCDW